MQLYYESSLKNSGKPQPWQHCLQEVWFCMLLLWLQNLFPSPSVNIFSVINFYFPENIKYVLKKKVNSTDSIIFL